MTFRKLFWIPALIFSSATVRADTIIYTFSSSLFDVSFSSQPSLIANDTIIPATSLLTNNTPDLQSVEINPTSFACTDVIIPIPDASSCLFLNQPNQSTGYFFSSQLTAPGSYSSGNAVLTITRNIDTSPVPEPSSLLLIVTGIGGILARSMRRLHNTSASRSEKFT